MLILKLKRFAAVIFLVTSLMATQAHALVVLQYHHIAEDTPAATSTSPARFAEHLAYLNKEGYKVIDLASAIDAINHQNLPLEKTVLITFDDGSSTIFDAALPLLKKYRYPFVVFINTDAVEQKFTRTLSWPQIKTLQKNGAAIANHSASHTHMVRMQPAENESAWLARMRNEIEQAQRLIKQHTGDNYPVFAYPFGEYNNALQGLLKNLGYIAFGQHSGPVGNFDPQALPRFPMGGQYGDSKDFRLKINTRPFEVLSYQLLDDQDAPFNPVLALQQPQPTMVISVKNTPQINALTCYLSPGGKTQKNIVSATTAHFTAQTAHPVGRSRFNCTAPAEGQRFYWHSIPFIRRHSDGTWAAE